MSRTPRTPRVSARAKAITRKRTPARNNRIDISFISHLTLQSQDPGNDWPTNFPLILKRAPLARSEQVSQFFFLRPQIFLGVRAGSNFAGNALDDVHAGAFESFYFVGIVREQPHAGDA